MDYLPQKLPPVENIRDLAAARGILRELLERLIVMEIENVELKRRLETLTTESDIKNLQAEINYFRQWLQHARGKMNGPMRPVRISAPMPPSTTEEGRMTAPEATGKDERRLSWIIFSWAMWSIIIVMGLLGIYSGFVAIQNPFSIDKSAHRSATQTNSPSVAASAVDPLQADVTTAPIVPGKQKESNMLTLSAAHPVGLVYYGNRWLSVDWMDGRIFELNPADGLKFPQAFPNSLTTGLSAGDNCLWSTDSFNHRCYKHDPKTFAVLASFPTPGPSPSAVYWDGSSLWLADKKTRRLYKYLNIQGDATALIHYQLLETDPVSLWRKDDLLWVLDREGKSIRRYRVDKELTPVDTLDISGWLAEKALPVGLALTGSEVWILTETPSFLYKHELKQLVWAASPKPKEEVQNTKQQAGGTKYVIQKGNSLASLARKFYGDPLKWSVIRDANPNIKDPARVTAGTVIVIPLNK
ncbi:MAG TPA: hypothetical protein DCL44_03810 [Elusimicrobia bacterium]|nr:hypothetical protein [Elusimicrobiota bacterium]